MDASLEDQLIELFFNDMQEMDDFILWILKTPNLNKFNTECQKIGTDRLMKYFFGKGRGNSSNFHSNIEKHVTNMKGIGNFI